MRSRRIGREAVYIPVKLDNHYSDSQKDVWVLWRVVGELDPVVCLALSLF